MRDEFIGRSRELMALADDLLKERKHLDATARSYYEQWHKVSRTEPLNPAPETITICGVKVVAIAELFRDAEEKGVSPSALMELMEGFVDSYEERE